MHPKVIGILGKPRDGKDTLARIFLEELRRRGLFAESFKFSDMLGEELDRRGIERTTANLQWMGQELVRETGDPAAVSNRMREWMQSRGGSYNVMLLNGVRWPADATLVRDLGGVLVRVQTRDDIALRRGQERRERVDDATLTAERFRTEREAPNEQYVDELSKNAEAVFDNNEDGESALRAAASRFLNEWLA